MIDDVLSNIDETLPDSLERLKALIRIPSISTVPKHASDCICAADWLVDYLESLGFESERMESDGHPLVFGKGCAGKPEFLFYGHYDVQPVDPLDLWDGNPFEPRMIETADGPAICARGASDDKGQLMTFLEACRAWREVTGAVPRSVNILLEGEEECGSPSLGRFLEKHRDLLGAELAVICDTGLFENRIPAIITQLRGLLAEEVILRAADMDLHSGMFGGIAANPVRVLAAALAGLHDADGRVTIDRFYDGVPELDPEIRDQWLGLDFNDEEFLAEVGLTTAAGERGRMPLEMIWSRPTCEFNGVNGGYTGDGFKTVLPSSASAKVSFRLVGTQDPDIIRQNFRKPDSSRPTDLIAVPNSKAMRPRQPV